MLLLFEVQLVHVNAICCSSFYGLLLACLRFGYCLMEFHCYRENLSFLTQFWSSHILRTSGVSTKTSYMQAKYGIFQHSQRGRIIAVFCPDLKRKWGKETIQISSESSGQFSNHIKPAIKRPERCSLTEMKRELLTACEFFPLHRKSKALWTSSKGAWNTEA